MTDAGKYMKSYLNKDEEEFLFKLWFDAVD